MFTHRHADGGFYRLICEANGKAPQKGYEGDWMPGVIYEGMDGEKRWTTKERWDERFEELPPSKFAETKTVELKDEEGAYIASYQFHIQEVDDVRLMFISAANASKKQRDHHTEMVLICQADMISKGLHLRDIDFPDLLGDVNAFHVKYRQTPEDYGTPRVLEPGLFDFRVKFHDEETTEYRDEQPKLIDAVAREDHREIVNSLELQLDALCDAAWVILGTADLQFGRKVFYEAWKRVVKANMAKVLATEDPNAADSGRDIKYDIRKPEGWVPPDHRDLVQIYLTHQPLETNTFNEDAGPSAGQ